MTFTERQRRAMGLIADTFVPGGDGAPSATEAGSHDLALEIAAKNPRSAETQQIKMLLNLWDSPGLGLALAGSPKRFSTRTQEEREKILLSFADSRLPQKRAVFGALKQAALMPYYMACGPDGWASTGYPGPLGVREPAPDSTLTVEKVDADTTLECDVVVVGSGAGGGTTAGVLAKAGLSVIVLEAGDLHDERDFDGGERHGIGDLYAPAPQSSADGQITLVAGRGVGGSTVVNYSTSFRTPDDVREEWAALGATHFTTAEYDEALDAVWERLSINTDHDKASSRDAVMERGAQAIGWHAAAMPRNVRGCDQGEDCGRCGLGCRLGAKQSTAKTWLADAVGHGARIISGVNVRRVTSANGRATGVEALAGGHQVTVKAHAVVAAAGAIQTPALLHRSGLGNRNIGRHLRLHPVAPVWGVFDERIDGWTGSMQSRYVDDLRDLDGTGYGALFETASLTPAFATGFLNWRGGAEFKRRMDELAHLVGIAVIVRDRDSVGTVKTGRDGEPVVGYRLSAGDSEHLLKGMEGAARIVEAAGAHTVYSGHTRTVSYRPGQDGDIARFSADVSHEGTGPGRLALASLHIMGSARMGGSADTSAVDPNGQTWDLPGLYVADGSCFPTASGVNPMVSIEAIAYVTAKRLAAALT